VKIINGDKRAHIRTELPGDAHLPLRAARPQASPRIFQSRVSLRKMWVGHVVTVD